MRPQFIGMLSAAQALLLLVKWVSWMLGIEVSWLVVLAPVWTLLAIAFAFWTVFGLLVRWIGS